MNGRLTYLELANHSVVPLGLEAVGEPGPLTYTPAAAQSSGFDVEDFLAEVIVEIAVEVLIDILT